MFRTHTIILSNQKIRDQFTRVVLFSREFGKIHCWYKKNGVPDITTLCEVTIEREGGFNQIKSFEKEYISETHCSFGYAELIEFLRIFSILDTSLPDSLEHRSIFDDIESCLMIPSRRSVQFYLLMQARILKKLGYLDQEHFQKHTVERYIYENLDTRSIIQLSEAKELDETIRNTLKISILESQHHMNFHP